MSDTRSIEGRISAWLEEREAGTHFPDRLLSATYEQTRTLRQARAPRSNARPAFRSWTPLAAAAAVAIAVGVLGFGLLADQAGPAATPSPTVAPSLPTGTTGGMWPQTTLDEVRAAQALAEAGDPTVLWQLAVDGGQVGQNHPCSGARNGCSSTGSGAIFIRFLQQRLGWEAFTWNERFAHREGNEAGDVIYVRCALGLTNPIYASDPDGSACAPTIDGLRYETVRIHVAQPVREDARGIWVVTDWEIIEPAAQRDAATVEGEATALLRDFLQARVAGRGAEALAEFAPDGAFDEEALDREIPLLYATTTGARYERSEYELVDGPSWPDAEMTFAVRLYADGGRTSVEQHFTIDFTDDGHVRLVYVFGAGYGSEEPGTTENGAAVPVRYAFLNGLMMYRAAWPLHPNLDRLGDVDQLAIEGLLPNDDAPRRIATIVVDPSPSALRCVEGVAPLGAGALAGTIQDDPTFDGPPPTALTIGGRPALQIDGAAASALGCGAYVEAVSVAGGQRQRLYLVDLPGGGPGRVLAISISADLDSFATVLAAALPVIESIEFHSS